MEGPLRPYVPSRATSRRQLRVSTRVACGIQLDADRVFGCQSRHFIADMCAGGWEISPGNYQTRRNDPFEIFRTKYENTGTCRSRVWTSLYSMISCCGARNAVNVDD